MEALIFNEVNSASRVSAIDFSTNSSLELIGCEIKVILLEIFEKNRIGYLGELIIDCEIYFHFVFKKLNTFRSTRLMLYLDTDGLF